MYKCCCIDYRRRNVCKHVHEVHETAGRASASTEWDDQITDGDLEHIRVGKYEQITDFHKLLVSGTSEDGHQEETSQEKSCKQAWFDEMEAILEAARQNHEMPDEEYKNALRLTAPPRQLVSGPKDTPPSSKRAFLSK